jgi:hypothetical protein
VKIFFPFSFSAFALAFLPILATAGIGTIESQVVTVNPSTGTYCQSISTSTYTRVPPASLGNMSRRNGIRVLNLPSNTANMGAVVSNSATAPADITNFDLLLVVDSAQSTYSIGDNLFLWVISLHTDAETACWQEYVQR